MNQGIFNCAVLPERLQAAGYSGGISILKEYAHPYRPAKALPAVRRYEPPAGRQFEDLEDLNRQALCRCRQADGKVHHTTEKIPLQELGNEGLRTLPPWETLDKYRWETSKARCWAE